MERLLWLAKPVPDHEAWPLFGQSLWCSRVDVVLPIVQGLSGTQGYLCASALCQLDAPLLLRLCTLVLNSVHNLNPWLSFRGDPGLSLAK